MRFLLSPFRQVGEKSHPMVHRVCVVAPCVVHFTTMVVASSVHLAELSEAAAGVGTAATSSRLEGHGKGLKYPGSRGPT